MNTPLPGHMPRIVKRQSAEHGQYQQSFLVSWQRSSSLARVQGPQAAQEPCSAEPADDDSNAEYEVAYPTFCCCEAALEGALQAVYAKRAINQPGRVV